MDKRAVTPPKADRLMGVLENVVRRRNAGESVPDEQVIAAHPDLLPELAEQLRRVAIVEQAARRADDTRSTFAPERGAEKRPSPIHPPVAREASSSLRTMSRTKARFEPGTLLAGRYRIVGLLGRGGMGEVYRADDLLIDQPVALKFLPAKYIEDPDRMALLLTEVRNALRATHANVCRVHDICQAEEFTFISMEYIDGEDLASLLRRIGRVSPDKAVELARQLCVGLGALHAAGVLHRDLKPANVMIDGRGNVRITDFGLSGLHDDEPAVGVRVGTPAYMAPEYLSGKRADARSDIYALGLILYELFTGHYAFETESRGVVDSARRTASIPRRPSMLIPDLDPRIERLILRCLDKDPDRRPPSITAVAAALPGGDPLAAALAAGETPSPDTVAASGAPGNLRPRTAAGLLAMILLGFALVAKFNDTAYLFARVPAPLSAEVLASQAQDLIRELGYDDPAVGIAWAFQQDWSLVARVGKHSNGPERWDWIERGWPAAITFWYRQSAMPLVAANISGIVSPNDPPLDKPGSYLVELDPRGRLLTFRAWPARKPAASAADSTESIPTADWSLLLRRAELEHGALQETPVDAPPQAYSDRTTAWRFEPASQGDVPARVLAGSLRGRPTYFRVEPLLDEESPFAGDEEPLGLTAANVVALLVRMLTLVGAILLAWQNVRKQRGDLRGAWRLGLYVFGAYLLMWALLADHTWQPALEWSLFVGGAARALFYGAWVWTLYVALEPYVRRWWPQCLISWERLLAGRLRDPMLGRDILIGATLAVATQLVALLLQHVPTWLGLTPLRPLPSFLGGLLGVRPLIGEILWGQVYACLQPMLVLLVILISRVVLRSALPGIVAAVVLFTATFVLPRHEFGQAAFLIDAAAFGLIVLAWIIVLLRFGLLATILAGLFLGLISYYTYSADLRAIHADASLAIFVFAAGLSLYGFWITTGRRPLLRDPLGEG